MIIKANIKEALRSLIAARQRAILALIGIVIGIGSVIAMVSVGRIVQSEVLKQFMDMGIDVISISKAYEGRGIKKEFQLADIMNIPKYINTVKDPAPYAMVSKNFSYGGKPFYLNLFGVTDSFFEINKIRIKQGRVISPLDRYTYHCVIGFDVAAYLKQKGFNEPIGKKFKFSDRIYTVVGIMDKLPDGGGMRPYGLNRSVIAHLTTGMRDFANGNINNIMARMTEGADPVEVNASIMRYFRASGRGLSVTVKTSEELIERMQKQMKLFTLLLAVIGSISLLVGGIGVMNVMLISVSERRKEIGIRRALGAQKGDIMGQFIIESVVLCLLGGILGILLGVGTSYAIVHFTKWTFMVSYMAVALGVCVSSIAGIFFGLYPAYHAAQLDPITALSS